MKTKLYYLSSILVFFLLFASCSKDNNPPEQQPEAKYLVSSENIANVSVDEVRARNSASAPFVASGVKVYRIVYKTEFPAGTVIEASGLIIMPDNDRGQLTMLSFQHGTITSQDEAPSAYKPVGNMEAYFGGTVAASLQKNFFVVMPDYIGYGASKDIQHPYIDKRSLAFASLDMLRAAKEFAEQNKIDVTDEVRLFGYSEGGYATLALHQAIQESAKDEFTVAASYPGAGPYDMVGTAQWVVGQTSDMPSMASSFYMFTLITYNTLYGINMPLPSLITPENAGKLAAAIAAGDPMAADVSDNPSELFTQSFIDGIKNETNTQFITALRNNNVYDWKPNAPVVLFHSMGDDIVPVLNAQNAETAMKAKGANVTFIPLGNLTHREAVMPYIQGVLGQLMK